MPKHFSEIVSGLAEGDLDDRLTARLADLVEKVEATGGTGKLTVTLAVSKQNRQVVIKPTIKVTAPEPAVDSSMFFVDKGGELTRDDPKQLKLPRVPNTARIVSLDGGKRSSEPTTTDED